MVIPNNTPDIEPILPSPPGPNVGPTKRPRWWRRTAAYALRRAADRTQGGKRRRNKGNKREREETRGKERRNKGNRGETKELEGKLVKMNKTTKQKYLTELTKERRSPERYQQIGSFEEDGL